MLVIVPRHELATRWIHRCHERPRSSARSLPAGGITGDKVFLVLRRSSKGEKLGGVGNARLPRPWGVVQPLLHLRPTRRENLHGSCPRGGWIATKRGLSRDDEALGRVQQQRHRERDRERERIPRDLRALLASNSKRARATCLEYSLVIFPSGHPPFHSSLPSSLCFSLLSLSLFFFSSSPVQLTPERYFICKEAACRLPLPLLISRAQECLLAGSKIPRYRTMTARERGIEREEEEEEEEELPRPSETHFVRFLLSTPPRVVCPLLWHRFTSLASVFLRLSSLLVLVKARASPPI